MEPKTKKWKKEELKSKNRHAQKYRQTVQWIPRVSPGEDKQRRLRWEVFAEKGGFEPGMKEWRGDGWWERVVDGRSASIRINASCNCKSVCIFLNRFCSREIMTRDNARCVGPIPCAVWRRVAADVLAVPTSAQGSLSPAPSRTPDSRCTRQTIAYIVRQSINVNVNVNVNRKFLTWLE